MRWLFFIDCSDKAVMVYKDMFKNIFLSVFFRRLNLQTNKLPLNSARLSIDNLPNEDNLSSTLYNNVPDAFRSRDGMALLSRIERMRQWQQKPLYNVYWPEPSIQDTDIVASVGCIPGSYCIQKSNDFEKAISALGNFQEVTDDVQDIALVLPHVYPVKHGFKILDLFTPSEFSLALSHVVKLMVLASPKKKQDDNFSSDYAKNRNSAVFEYREFLYFLRDISYGAVFHSLVTDSDEMKRLKSLANKASSNKKAQSMAMLILRDFKKSSTVSEYNCSYPKTAK